MSIWSADEKVSLDREKFEWKYVIHSILGQYLVEKRVKIVLEFGGNAQSYHGSLWE